MKQLTGRADIYLNSSYIETTQDGSTISTLGGVENTLVVNSRGQTAGYTTKATPAQIKVAVTHGPDFDITTYLVPGISMEFVCDNGPTYQIANCVYLKDDGLDPSKGTVMITFGGDLAAGVALS